MPLLARVWVLALVAAGAAAGPAAAARCVAPPGTAAIDQYCETIPTAEGDRRAEAPAPAAPAPGPAPARTAAVLAGAGPDGAALARAVRAQAPPEPRRRRSAAPGPQPAPPGGAVSAVGPVLSPGGTLGGGLVAVLLVTGAALAGWAGVRARRRAGAS